MKPVRLRGLLLLAALPLLPACASKEALPGAVYANAVAVYRNAEFDGAMGGTSSEDFGGEAQSESMSWFFDTKDSKEKIIAFYEKELPGATREVSEEGEVTFTFVPAGAEPGEEVKVIVKEGGIQIFECTKPGKHKESDCYDKAMESTGLGWMK